MTEMKNVTIRVRALVLQRLGVPQYDCNDQSPRQPTLYRSFCKAFFVIWYIFFLFINVSLLTKRPLDKPFSKILNMRSYFLSFLSSIFLVLVVKSFLKKIQLIVLQYNIHIYSTHIQFFTVFVFVCTRTQFYERMKQIFMKQIFLNRVTWRNLEQFNRKKSKCILLF